MKIIIVGCGKVGQKLAERLNQEKEHSITAVDIRYDVIQDTTNSFDVMGVVGSGTNIDTLKEAGIENADILIAVTGSDELNLVVCLMAKKLGKCRTIARVRKPEYNKMIHLLKEDLSLAMVINPERTAASEIARVLRFPSAIQIDTFAKGRIEILKFKIPEKSPLDNLKVGDIVAKLNCDILVCGVERGDDAFIPGGNFILKSGDLISIVSSIQNGAYFFKKIGFNTNRVKDTMIIGGGETGYYLANQLIETGINVKIIEQDATRCDELCQLLPKATIINGDGTDNRLLLEEGIESAESVVSLTNIDEENILLSLFAKSKSNAKIVTKINRIAYDEVIDKLDLDTTIYPKNITAEYIIRFVRAKNNTIGSNIETMHLILDGKAEALEFRISENSPVSNITIESLELKKNILIACINRNGKIIIPRGKDMILPNDTVIVVTLKSGFADISDILE
ncbi:MAG: Trk system potassium transporter TrkA [Ruminococcaceae bacterium]|nr:Trk system potassium transporter TrkA [Oscillospiraceae bacterium]